MLARLHESELRKPVPIMKISLRRTDILTYMSILFALPTVQGTRLRSEITLPPWSRASKRYHCMRLQFTSITGTLGAAANNVIVASHLDGRLDAVEAANCLDELLTRFPCIDDDLLIRSNLGGTRLLEGDLSASMVAFVHTDERLKSTPDIDPFYRYLVESNRAIAGHLIGDKSAKHNWEVTEKCISGNRAGDA